MNIEYSIFDTRRVRSFRNFTRRTGASYRPQILRFFFAYILYMMLIFGAMALLWKFAYEAGWTKSGLTGVAMLLLLMLLIGAPPVWFSAHYGQPSGAQKRVLQSGNEAVAQILEVVDTGLSLGNPDLGFVVRLTLWVEPSGGQAFQAQIETSISRANVPRKGETVRVKFDPKHCENVVSI